jgi:hypothetical protein
VEVKFPKIVKNNSQHEGTQYKSRALSKKWINIFTRKVHKIKDTLVLHVDDNLLETIWYDDGEETMTVDTKNK